MSYIGVYKKPGDSATTTVSGVTFSSSQPSSPVSGQLWYKNSSPPEMKIYDGSDWVTVMIGSNFSLSGNTLNITN